MVHEYTGLNFIEIEDLRIDVYLLLMRDAFVHRKSQTEEGREYLENCWRLEQTRPDRKKLRDKFGRKE